MRYPKYLLPKRYFRLFLIDELKPIDFNFQLIRRSLKIRSETFDKFGQVKPAAVLGQTPDGNLNIKEVPGLSLVLLGGKFKSEHIKFRGYGIAMSNWPLKQDVTYQEVSQYIEELPNDQCVPIYFSLKQVHNSTVPYIRPVDKNFKKKIPKEFMIKEGPNELKAAVTIVHKPTLCNYWHIEFYIKDLLSKEEIKKDKISTSDLESEDAKSWKYGTQIAFAILENIIATNGKEECSKPSKISPRIYNDYLFRAAKWIKSIFETLTSRQH